MSPRVCSPGCKERTLVDYLRSPAWSAKACSATSPALIRPDEAESAQHVCPGSEVSEVYRKLTHTFESPLPVSSQTAGLVLYRSRSGVHKAIIKFSGSFMHRSLSAHSKISSTYLFSVPAALKTSNHTVPYLHYEQAASLSASR